MRSRNTVGPFSELERAVPPTVVTTCLSSAAALVTAFIACAGRPAVQCEQDSNCDLGASGLCVASTSGNNWCAYPDSNCQSGYRFSDVDVGDGVGGLCTDGPSFQLRVLVGGNGRGSVSVEPTGLECSAGTCTGSFPSGTRVVLTAATSSGAFLGWSD